MKKTVLSVAFVVLVVAIGLPSHAFELGVRGYYWFPSLSGDLRVDDEDIVGTKLDLEKDLGMEDESYPILEVFGGLGNHHISLSYFRADYDGTTTLTSSITFNGRTYLAGSRIRSNLDYDLFDLQYRYTLVDLENVLAGFSLGIVARVEVFDSDVSIESLDFNVKESESFLAPIPSLGLHFHIGLLSDILECRILATGIGYSKGYLFDGQADISFTPFPFLDIHGGYRAFVVDVDEDDFEFAYRTLGPYVALTVGF